MQENENKILKIEYPLELKLLEAGIVQGFKECCHAILNPPISNLGLEGIKKWAKIMVKWPQD